MNVNETARRYLDAKRAMAEAKAAMEEAKAALCEMLDMAERDEFATGDYTVRRSRTAQMRFDTRAFKSDFADVYDEYRHPVTVNNFYVVAA